MHIDISSVLTFGISIHIHLSTKIRKDKDISLSLLLGGAYWYYILCVLYIIYIMYYNSDYETTEPRIFAEPNRTSVFFAEPNRPKPAKSRTEPKFWLLPNIHYETTEPGIFAEPEPNRTGQSQPNPKPNWNFGRFLVPIEMIVLPSCTRTGNVSHL